MKLCQEHQDRLQAALDARALDRVIVPKGQPDPFAAARFALILNLLTVSGPMILVPKADGSLPCPMCYAVEAARGPCDCGKPDCTPDTRAAAYSQWIDYAADEMLKRYAGAKGAA
jgi:hypothetical protein